MKMTLSLSIMITGMLVCDHAIFAQQSWAAAPSMQDQSRRQIDRYPNPLSEFQQLAKQMIGMEQSYIPGDENWGDQFAAPGTNGVVYAIATINNTVYVGGSFSEAGGLPVKNIAKWDGKRWSAMGSGVNGTVLSMAVSGNDLYVGGTFTKAGEIDANYLVKWDGSTWSLVENGLNGAVRAIGVQDSNLYVGGEFSEAGGVTTNRIAKWNGHQWSALGTGVSGINEAVNVITVSGSVVYVGGVFETIDGVYVNHIAKWNGSRWQPLGPGVFVTPYAGPYYGGVHAIAVRGSDVYVGGYINGAGVSSATGIARWNGSEWLKVGGASMQGPVWSIVFDGNNLYAGGFFDGAPGLWTRGLARWDGVKWSALSNGISGAPILVFALAVRNNNLYVGGDYWKADDFTVRNIAQWDGQVWKAMGNEIIGLNEQANALVHSDSSVYVAGWFITADHLIVNRVARWDGKKWSGLGSGLNEGALAMVKHNNNIYVAGAFTQAGNVQANFIAKWNGLEWSTLSSGVNNFVNALAISDSEIYAGGEFTEAGGIPASHIAKWNGNSWSSLGNGVNGRVNALAVDGNNIYVGGTFNEAGGLPVSNIARWDGSRWLPLGSGVNSEVTAIVVRDDEIFVGGYFTEAGGVRAKYIAKWDGYRWWDLDSRMDGAVTTITFNAGILYAGGYFSEAGGVVADGIAKWYGTIWSGLGSGLSGYPFALLVNDHDLYVAGGFGRAGNKGAAGFARWHEPNLAPLARSDSATIDEEIFVTLDLTSNDQDADGTIVTNTLNIIQSPAHGAVQNHGDGSVTYSPEANFAGEEVFTYTVNDAQGVPSNQAIVRITVNNINDAPLLDNSGVMLLKTILMSDTTSAGDAVADIIASAGGDRIAEVDSGAVEGIAVIGKDDTNGAWQYSINNGVNWITFGEVADAQAVLLNPEARIRFKPKVDFYGQAGDITFRAWDQTAGTNGQTNVDASTNGGTTAFSLNTETATLKVNVRPFAENDTLFTEEDNAINVDVANNDTDIDGNIIRNSINIIEEPQHGTLTANADSTLRYSPNTNFNGQDGFKYTLKDNDGAVSNEASVSLIITAVNDAPSAFRRLQPVDNRIVNIAEVTFSWTQSQDVDDDTVTYVLHLLAGRLDTSFVTLNTVYIVDFRQLNLDSDSLTVTWTVVATDGNIETNATNGIGVFTLDLATDISDYPSQKLPSAFILHANYPNPMRVSVSNSRTILRYELPHDATVRLEIYDVLGRLVRTLVDEKQPVGAYRYFWDGVDNAGTRVNSGTYFYRLYAKTSNSGVFIDAKKMSVIN
jgi:hypothetical protein